MQDKVDRLQETKDLAIREYFHVSDLIDRFDARSLHIKSWSVTLSAASIGFSISQNIPILLLLSSFSALIFWILETIWKYYQAVLIEHSENIENALRTDLSLYNGPSISLVFKENLTWQKEVKAFPDIFWYRNVMLPHFIIIVAGIFGYAYSLLS